MQLLHSMTGATPETKLILMTWASRLGSNFQSGNRSYLARALGVSIRNLDIALEYLLSEGYLWKIKSPLERQKGENARMRFAYGLTTECWRMWCEFHAACAWQNELIFVLNGKTLADNDSSEKSIRITTKMRLVWVVLLTQSNNARFIVGTDDLALCQLMGMTQLELRRAINALVFKGVISIVASGIVRTEMMGYLPPIYKMQMQQLDRKTVRFGVNLSSGLLIPLSCISRLTNFYSRACKLAKGRYPSQNSQLTDEQYFELSKLFSCNKLVVWVNHFCLSYIFSLLPVYISTQRSGSEVGDGFMSLLHKALSQVFFGAQSTFSDVPNTHQDKNEHNDVIDKLKQYLLHVLTKESYFIIQELASQWQLFVECMGEDGRIVDYKQEESMTYINNSQLEDKGSNSNFNWMACCVLAVMTPEHDDYSDSMVLGQQLFTSNIKLKHQKVFHVQKLLVVPEDI